MTADSELSRELAALHDELSAARREQPSSPGDRQQAGGTNEAPRQAQGSGANGQTAEQIQDFIDTVKEFIEDAEHNVSEHPAAGVIGAFLLGIIVGRLIWKR